MGYLSSFFRATRSVMDLQKDQDPKLIQLFMGVVGVPEGCGIDAVELKTQFVEFTARELRRGPLRREDVVKVAQMVRLQEKERVAFTQFDAQTGTTWEWTGNPLVLVVVCGLACEAAVRLEDQDLFVDCASLLWAAVESIKDFDAPEFDQFRPLANAEAEAIAKRIDVAAQLDAFDGSMPRPQTR